VAEARQVPGQLLCRMRIPLRWGDQDAVGHVNNTVYFRLAEEIRIVWCCHLGIVDGLGSTPGPVIVNASMTFVRSLHYPSNVLVTMRGANPGRSSFDTYYTLADDKTPDILYAHGAARCVWVDHASEKSCPMPQHVRAALLNPVPVLLDT